MEILGSFWDQHWQLRANLRTIQSKCGFRLSHGATTTSNVSSTLHHDKLNGQLQVEGLVRLRRRQFAYGAHFGEDHEGIYLTWLSYRMSHGTMLPSEKCPRTGGTPA